jgi:hypothetical protein
MKRLLVCLLLVGVVGCGESEQTQKQPSGESQQVAQQPSGESQQESSPDGAQRNANLAACPDCEGKVSKRAATCPHCGSPLTKVKILEAPSLGMVNPTQFMNDLTSTIGEFGDLLDSFDDEQSVIDAEEEIAGLITRMETVSNQSMGMTEPPAEEREKLMEMFSVLEDLVRRLEVIEERQQLNGEDWKAVKDNFGRFVGAMRMVPMVPPASPVDPNPTSLSPRTP